MKLFAGALLLVSALLSPPATAGDEFEVFVARTTGELTIDAEGRVAEVSLDRKQLGDSVMEGFERLIRQWQFEPIEQDGRPVRAKARMSLDLVVIRHPEVEGLRLGFEQVQFIEPARQEAAAPSSYSMQPPRYPEEELRRGIGARVMLLVQMDAEGQVTSAAAESVLLLGEEVGRHQERHARNLGKAAEKAAAGWRLPGIEGGVARVPVHYYAPNQGRDHWIRSRSVPIDPPAWVVAAQASNRVIALGAGGGKSSERWKLLTPLGG